MNTFNPPTIPTALIEKIKKVQFYDETFLGA